MDNYQSMVHDMKLSDLIDIPVFQGLSDSFTKLTGLPTAILDLQGKVLIASGWRKICTDFHRKHSITAARCLESDTVLAGQLTQGNKFNIYQCKNGLIDVAAPIFIENVHIGNVFVGQFLFEMPDVSFFSKQAETFGFDKAPYLEALSLVPILSKEEISKALDYLSTLTIVIGNAGLDKKRLLDLNKTLEKRILDRTQHIEHEKQFSESLINSLPGVMYVFDQSGHFIRWNQNFEDVSGYTSKEILGMHPLDFIATEDKSTVKEAITRVFEEGYASVEAGLEVITGEIFSYLFTGYRYTHNEVNYLIGVGLDISDRIKAESEKAHAIQKLKQTLSKVKQLSGLLPICSSCKKIRDDKGYWSKIESYVRKHSGAEFSHGLCPECSEKIYGNHSWYADLKKNNGLADF